jgi:hypothetical protein
MANNPFTIADPVKAIIRIRRGPESDREQYIYDDGELVWSTDKQRAFVGNGIDYGGISISNKVWVVDNFQKLPSIQKNDCVYRTDTNSFYILTGYNYLMENNYILVGGVSIINNNINNLNTQNYSLPDATDSKKGGVIVGDGLQVDNSVISINYDDAILDIIDGKLTIKSASVNTSVDTGSYTTLGIVRVVPDNGLKIYSGGISLLYDNDTLKLKDVSGVKKLYVDFSTIPKSTDTFTLINSNINLTTKSLSVLDDSGLILTNEGNLSLNQANGIQIGGVKLGNSIISNDGTINVKIDDLTIKNDRENGVFVNTTELSGTVGLSGYAASNGWQAFPNGVIMQWGSSNITSSTTNNVTFPIPYKSSVYSVLATHSTSNSNVSAVAVKNINTTGFIGEIASSATLTFYWQSIGF